MNNSKINLTLASIEKYESKLINRTRELKELVAKSQEERSKEIVPAPTFKRTWGPGKAVPEDIKSKVLELLKEKHTGREIKQKFNISLPTIHKIKQSAGMVRSRSILV